MFKYHVILVLFPLALVVAGFSNAHGNAILSYSVPNGSPPVVQDEHPGLDGSEIAIPAGSSISVSGPSYIDWATDTADRDAAIVANSFLEFDFTSSGLFAYDLDSFQVTYDVGLLAPSEVSLGYSFNGAPFTYIQLSTASNQTTTVVNLSGINGVTSGQFQLVGWTSISATGNNELTFIDFGGGTGYSMALNGTAVLVPEPSTWAALCCLGVGLVTCYRRR